MKKILYTAFSIMLATCTALHAQQKNEPKTTPQTINATIFQSKLESSTQAVLVDVRTPEEVAQGKIPGAVNIDFYAPDFKAKVAALDKTKTYFVYCAKGSRSGQAVEEMADLGFKNLYSLQGGFVGWKEQGMPVK